MFKKFVPIVFLSSLLSRSAHACAACFGGLDGNFKSGFTWGVVVLGSLPFLLVIGFIISIVRASRRHHRPL